MKDKLTTAHRQAYSTSPSHVVFAPGRINFIGEHTDYNGGLVMPLALNQGIAVAISANGTDKFNIYSLGFDTKGSFEIGTLAPDPAATWANCPKGIAKVMMDNGYAVKGADLTITGNLPIGAGLSSSAAVEVAVGFALQQQFGLEFDKKKLALMAQAAEHEFTGTKCGIMDQLISAMGKKDHLLKLDCETLETEYIPFDLHGAVLLITNTKVSHDLATSEYNQRRSECAAGFEAGQQINGSITTLSDLTREEVEGNQNLFSEVVFKRVHHVVSENERVRDTARALAAKDLEQVGRNLYASHASLKDNYEVTCPELDWLADLGKTIRGVYGARMTGGGFGGCVITLVTPEGAQVWKEKLAGYVKEFGIEPEVYTAAAGDGVRVL